MVKQPPAASAPDRRAWPRYVAIAAGLLLVLGVLAVVFGPSVLVSYRIRGLNSDDGKERRANETKLTESQDEGVDEKLLSVVRDDDESFRVREAAARILYKRQRLALVESVLRDGSPRAKAAVISVLAGQSHFLSDYVENASWGVRDAVRTWLRDEGDRARSRAVQIALMKGVELREAMPEIRGMLTRRPQGVLPDDEQRYQLLAAMAAAVQFKDCESAAAVAALAEKDPEPIVRMTALHEAFKLSGAPGSPCPEALPPERLQARVLAALGDAEKIVRMGAFTDLEHHHPAWANDAPVRSRLLEVLDGEGSAEERRGALGALAASKDATVKERLPRYFHDRSPYVRSTAVSAARAFATDPLALSGFEGCFIGLFRFETENAAAVSDALGTLQRTAREWVGLPDDVRRDAANRSRKFGEFVAEIFQKGQSRGVDREAWAKEWFRWHAGQLGLSPDEAAQALETQDRFWKAAKGGDAAAARASLEAFPRKVPGLFCYEEGWLASRAP